MQADILVGSVKESPQPTNIDNEYNNNHRLTRKESNTEMGVKSSVYNVEEAGTFYIQTNAYSLLDGASKDVAEWEGKLNVPVRIHEEPDQGKPLYKVLIGPFITREEAKNYQIENNITRSDVKEFLETNFLNNKNHFNHV